MSDRHVAVVVKIGSSWLVDREGRLDGAFLDRFAVQIAELAKAGKRPVLVTSGAVASGIGILGLPRRPAGIAERQALAAIGQVALAHRWQAGGAAGARAGRGPGAAVTSYFTEQYVTEKKKKKKKKTYC